MSLLFTSPDSFQRRQQSGLDSLRQSAPGSVTVVGRAPSSGPVQSSARRSRSRDRSEASSEPDPAPEPATMVSEPTPSSSPSQAQAERIQAAARAQAARRELDFPIFGPSQPQRMTGEVREVERRGGFFGFLDDTDRRADALRTAGRRGAPGREFAGNVLSTGSSFARRAGETGEFAFNVTFRKVQTGQDIAEGLSLFASDPRGAGARVGRALEDRPGEVAGTVAFDAVTLFGPAAVSRAQRFRAAARSPTPAPSTQPIGRGTVQRGLGSDSVIVDFDFANPAGRRVTGTQTSTLAGGTATELRVADRIFRVTDSRPVQLIDFDDAGRLRTAVLTERTVVEATTPSQRAFFGVQRSQPSQILRQDTFLSVDPTPRRIFDTQVQREILSVVDFGRDRRTGATSVSLAQTRFTSEQPGLFVRGAQATREDALTLATWRETQAQLTRGERTSRAIPEFTPPEFTFDSVTTPRDRFVIARSGEDRFIAQTLEPRAFTEGQTATRGVFDVFTQRPPSSSTAPPILQSLPAPPPRRGPIWTDSDFVNIEIGSDTWAIRKPPGFSISEPISSPRAPLQASPSYRELVIGSDTWAIPVKPASSTTTRQAASAPSSPATVLMDSGPTKPPTPVRIRETAAFSEQAVSAPRVMGFDAITASPTSRFAPGFTTPTTQASSPVLDTPSSVSQVPRVEVSTSGWSFDTITAPRTDSGTAQIDTTDSFVGLDSRVSLLPRTRQRRDTDSGLVQIPAQVPIQAPRQTPIPSFARSPALRFGGSRVGFPPPPVIPGLIGLPSLSRRQQARATGFRALVRIGGVFRPVGPVLSRQDALQFGARKVSQTPAASFKIAPAGFAPQVRLGLRGFFNGFDRSKREEGVFVEPVSRRIQSPGELRGITFKGLQAQRLTRRRIV